MQLLTYHAPL